MGVFSRFRRKSSEASTEEAATATLTAESADATETGAEATEPEESDEAEAEAQAAEGVEIPKQQSAEKAVDSEAGEGARK
ncbi:gliding motility protein [Streptomyces hiroshimensis]|uniref:Gliding motility protein n=1 Tax=Streptomyces hiroshimensis TaxID=66424 RepID=A0ABQ2Y5C8_9ACTN|nr:gliding motility protein [Streptomyces hiroshimensis]GGX59732.1 hypothetical protein GCM10010324_00350 [Streptomyces hiroshimensis]